MGKRREDENKIALKDRRDREKPLPGGTEEGNFFCVEESICFSLKKVVLFSTSTLLSLLSI